MNAASHVLMIAAVALYASIMALISACIARRGWRRRDLLEFCMGWVLCALGLLMAGGALALIGEFNA